MTKKLYTNIIVVMDIVFHSFLYSPCKSSQSSLNVEIYQMQAATEIRLCLSI